jgi:DUF4097 and DUF4098 domain-containing protein YvlB
MIKYIPAFVLLISASAADTVKVPFSDPSRPGTVKVSLINGGITVKGYDGKEVLVEANSGERHHRPAERTDGLHRIDMVGSGLNVEESENVIRIGTRSPNDNASIVIQVPFATSLKLNTINGGSISVDQVRGDLELEDTNGSITATHISGSVIAHALNGRVLVTFDEVKANKSLSFSSLNGAIDVTLPANTKANVKLKSDNGEVYTDFDINLTSSGRQPTVEDSRSGKGKYRIQFDRGVFGTINGGGPDMSFTTFNGNVYLRKAK